jgi:hypothetical protein
MNVIAFPGGSGGHFIGYITKMLISKQSTATQATYNFHLQTKPDQSFLNFSVLDPKHQSWEEELCYIKSINSKSQLVLGHFRNIDAIVDQHQCKVVTIQISDKDHDLLVARVLREAIDFVFDHVKYQDIRGEDWPEVNPGFSKLPRWVQLEVESLLHKMFYFWNDSIKCSYSNVLKLTTHDIFYGEIIEKIAGYLNTPVAPGMDDLHKNYKQLVHQKYCKKY